MYSLTAQFVVGRTILLLKSFIFRVLLKMFVIVAGFIHSLGRRIEKLVLVFIVVVFVKMVGLVLILSDF